MGLLASVYRNAEHGDCSNNGITARFKRVCVVEFDGKPVVGPFEPSDDCPAVRIVVRDIPSLGMFGIIHAEPIDGEPGRYMHGGSFIYSSDSRFNDIYPAPISVHDRWER